MKRLKARLGRKEPRLVVYLAKILVLTLLHQDPALQIHLTYDSWMVHLQLSMSLQQYDFPLRVSLSPHQTHLQPTSSDILAPQRLICPYDILQQIKTTSNTWLEALDMVSYRDHFLTQPVVYLCAPSAVTLFLQQAEDKVRMIVLGYPYTTYLWGIIILRLHCNVTIEMDQC